MFLNPDFQVDEESEVKRTYTAPVFYNIYQDTLNLRMFFCALETQKLWKKKRSIMAGAKLPSDYGTIIDKRFRKSR